MCLHWFLCRKTNDDRHESYAIHAVLRFMITNWGPQQVPPSVVCKTPISHHRHVCEHGREINKLIGVRLFR
jgi:hypothetical protein